MAFIQKDRYSRKDKLDLSAAGPGPKRVPRVVVHRHKDGQSHLHLDIPEGAASKEAHLDDLLSKLEADRAVETEVKEGR